MPIVGLFDVFQRRCCLLPNILIAITAASKFHLKRKKEEREREKKRKERLFSTNISHFHVIFIASFSKPDQFSDKNVKLRSNFTFLSQMRPKP
jgi:hypothetical protein